MMNLINILMNLIFHSYFPILLNTSLYRYFSAYYENFLLVILCKYDLGLVRFAIAKWFFCGLFMLCCVESAYAYLGSIEDLVNLMQTTFSAEPALPKDLHILEYKTANPVETIESIDSTECTLNDKRPYRYYTYTCALVILYLGACVAHSGG